MPIFHIYKNEKETCYAFADWMADLIAETLKRQEKFSLALVGENIPKLLYKILTSDYIKSIEWSKVHVFLNDLMPDIEPQKKRNNTEVKSLLEKLPVPPLQMHIPENNMQHGDAAHKYEETMRACFKNTGSFFDLVILSIGENRNSYSFFPVIDETIQNRQVIPIYDEEEGTYKITLSSAVINASSVKAFLVTGTGKQDTVQQILKGKYEPEKYPEQLIQTVNKTVHWFLDEAASAKLINSAG